MRTASISLDWGGGNMAAALFRFLSLALALLAMAAGLPAAAQTTLRADWTAMNKNNFQQIDDGDALTVGPNRVTINTRVNRDGDGNDAGFVPYYSTGMLSYYTGQIGGSTGVLFFSTNHTVFDAGDYFESTFTLDTAVSNLAFRLSNVDRYLADPFFHDGVVIEYDTGSGTWLNLRSLATAYTLGSAVGTTTINGQAGFHGTAYSGGITSQTGDIAVNFGTVSVKRVRIRYLFGQGSPSLNPSGNWQYMGMSDMTWSQTGVLASDLSLTKSVSNAAPTSGSTVSYTLSLLNSGPASASNVIVSDVLPTGFSFQSSSGYGSYDQATGQWTVASIASGQTRTLTITGTVTAGPGVTVTNLAEVYSSPNYDTDSTPNNGVAGEDDIASVSFTVQGTRSAGVPPVLSCSLGSSVFDWDTRSWSAGSLNNTYSLTNIGQVAFDLSSSGAWVNDPAFGGQSPSLSTANTGGLATAQNSLHQYLDFASRSQIATTVISLETAVPGAQFTVFDVDYADNDFADKMTVTGTFNGTTVTPTLTNGVSNYVVGNTVIGDAASDGTSANGNVVVTFQQPVDTITIVYGNATTAPSNPDGQAIAIHDITFCNPSASVTIAKTSSVLSDPVSGTDNPKAIPGAVIRYCILVSNGGSGTAASVVVTDPVPTGVTFVPGSFLTGTTCAGASTVEDDDAAGADESDPYGASIAGTTISGSATSIAPSSTFALVFEATVD